VRWTVCNLSVCRKINRQYKHNLSCTVLGHRRLYWQINRPSTSHKELHKYWLYRLTQSVGISQRVVEMPQSPTTRNTDTFRRHFIESWCHNHRQFYRRIQSIDISQRVVEMPQSLTWIPMDCICRYLLVVHNYQQNHQREFHKAGINASLVACTC